MFKCPGGKRYLSQWIIGHFPENYREMNYVETCGGAGSVLLNKDRSRTEVFNDLHPGIHAIFRQIVENDGFTDELRKVEYTQESFKFYLSQVPKTDLETAVREFVLRRMSRGGMKRDFGWSNRERNGIPGDLNAWNTFLDHLPLIRDRLAGVELKNKDVMELIDECDRNDTLFYVDPPYIHSSRNVLNLYDMEMTDDQHSKLCHRLKGVAGKVVLSGYYNQLYSKILKGWKMQTKDVPNHSSQSQVKERRIEVIWRNYG